MGCCNTFIIGKIGPENSRVYPKEFPTHILYKIKLKHIQRKFYCIYSMESAPLLRIYKLFEINDFHIFFLKGFLSFYLYWDLKCFLFLKCMLFLYIKINYCHLSFEYIFHLRCIVFCDRNVETHLLLRDPSIVLNIPQKYHTLPADVLPSASEDLFDGI